MIDAAVLPTPEMMRHYAVSATRTGIEVETRVRQLALAGRIDAAQFAATLRFYADWALGVVGARDRPDAPSRARPGASGGYALRRLEALQAHRLACAAVGPGSSRLLERVVCLDESWLSLAASLRCRRTQAQAVVVMAIVALCEHYQAADGARRNPRPVMAQAIST